jgi:hypothetical protein
MHFSMRSNQFSKHFSQSDWGMYVQKKHFERIHLENR